MPLYDWKCEHCDLRVTLMHHHSKSNEPPTAEELIAEESPVHCSGNATEGQHKWKMLIGKVSFQLMGRGWASDGYE